MRFLFVYSVMRLCAFVCAFWVYGNNSLYCSKVGRLKTKNRHCDVFLFVSRYSDKGHHIPFALLGQNRCSRGRGVEQNLVRQLSHKAIGAVLTSLTLTGLIRASRASSTETPKRFPGCGSEVCPIRRSIKCRAKDSSRTPVDVV